MTSAVLPPATRKAALGRVVIVLVAGANAAISWITTAQWNPPDYGSWALGRGVPLVIALAAAAFGRRRAAFGYAIWSVLSTFLAFAVLLGLYDSFPYPAQSVFDMANWSVGLSVLAIGVGYIVGALLPGKVPPAPPSAPTAERQT